MAIITNRKAKSATTLDVANATYSIANLQTSNTDTFTGMAINQIYFASNGVWTITKGNTSISLMGSDHWNLAGHNVPIQSDPTANIVITLSTGSVGTLMLDIRKLNGVVETNATP